MKEYNKQNSCFSLYSPIIYSEYEPDPLESLPKKRRARTQSDLSECENPRRNRNTGKKKAAESDDEADDNDESDNDDDDRDEKSGTEDSSDGTGGYIFPPDCCFYLYDPAPY